MRTQEIWGNFPLGSWKCYGLWGCSFPQEAVMTFVEPLLGALFTLHCRLWCFLSSLTLSKIKYSWKTNGLCNVCKVECGKNSSRYPLDSHLRTWHLGNEVTLVSIFWNCGSFCGFSVQSFTQLISCMSMLNIHANYFFCILKISQFFTVVWQQGFWWDNLEFLYWMKTLNTQPWPFLVHKYWNRLFLKTWV